MSCVPRTLARRAVVDISACTTRRCLRRLCPNFRVAAVAKGWRLLQAAWQNRCMRIACRASWCGGCSGWGSRGSGPWRCSSAARGVLRLFHAITAFVCGEHWSLVAGILLTPRRMASTSRRDACQGRWCGAGMLGAMALVVGRATCSCVCVERVGGRRLRCSIR